MALDEGDWGGCHECGTSVKDRSAMMLILREGNQKRSVVLCEDCATLRCGICGSPVPLRSGFEGERRGGTWVIECSRCGTDVGLEEAVELRHESDPHYSKRICADCLGDISVPEGYIVVRDFAPE